MALIMERLLPSTNHLHTIVRSVSSKYTKPHPRSYRRRLFEAAVKPVMPEKIITCGTWKETVKQRNEEWTSFMPIEFALVDKIRNWIKDENFRVMLICQLQSVSSQTVYLAKNQLRMKEIYYAGYSSRIMGKLFESTPLRSLEPLIYGSENCFLFGRELDSIKVMIDEAAKIPFIIPLAMTVDSRILSIEETNRLAKFSSVEDLCAETVQILQKIPADLAQSLDLVNTLGRISSS